MTRLRSKYHQWASLVAQLVKNPPAVQETPVRFLGWEDPLEKGTAPHSSILAWRIPRTVETMGLQRVKHDRATFTLTSDENVQTTVAEQAAAAQVLSRMRFSANPWTAVHRAPLPVQFSKQGSTSYRVTTVYH